MLLPLLLSAAKNAADTTHKIDFAQKLESFSDRSLRQMVEHVTGGVISIAIKICIAVAVYFIGRWLIRYIRRIMGRMMERRQVDPSLRTFLQNLVKIALTFFLITVIIGILGIDTTSFVALFASAGLAIGMALSGTLQNFAGGVMVLLFKPYRVGDFIEAQGQSGTVKEIQLFNTVLNTADNKTILVPNGSLSTGIINNYSREARRRVDWTFGIGYGDDYDFAKATLAELLDADSRVMKDPAYFIALQSLGDSSVNIVVRAWVSTADYWSVYFDLNEKVYKVFTQKGINIPFPQMDVHLIPSPAPKKEA